MAWSPPSWPNDRPPTPAIRAARRVARHPLATTPVDLNQQSRAETDARNPGQPAAPSADLSNTSDNYPDNENFVNAPN